MARRYTDEFKQEAVRLYRESGRGYRVLGSELGVSAYSLRQWVQRAKKEGDASLLSSESEELKRLRRENKVLREEREILRKAAAFFATEDRRTR